MIEKRNRFKAIYPDKYFADQDDLVCMTEYLKSINFLGDLENLTSADAPGAGNMNYVLRVKTDRRTFILKQSRPWVEKYPSIDAPIDRIKIEATYFEILKNSKALKQHSPEIYHVDLNNFLMLMEDLGDVEDYTHLYKSGDKIEDDTIKSLATYLSALHNLEVSDFPDNLKMRKLNHEHIFNFPFVSDSGFDLDSVQPGLSDLAVNEKTDSSLVNTIRKSGEIYLSTEGSTLLHGDFYPGSWLKVNKSLYVIDAEFGFLGPREFDLGVFIAHMKMAGQPDDSVNLFLAKYKEGNSYDRSLTYRFAGIEILRRLLGVAQLPLKLSLEKKSELLKIAKGWIR